MTIEGGAPEWLVRNPFAHRGLHSADRDIPENSLAAFDAAARAGYGIELDLQLSRDGKAVVFHDRSLERMTEARGPVRDLPLTDLGQLTLAATTERIPSLADMLETVGGRVPILVEVKTDAAPAADIVAAAWKDLARYEGPFAIISFDPMALSAIRRLAPQVPRGQTAMRYRSGRNAPNALNRFLLQNFYLNWIGAPDFVTYNVEDLPCAAARRMRRRGFPLLAWTVRTEADLEKAIRHADNYIFEDFTPETAGRSSGS